MWCGRVKSFVFISIARAAKQDASDSDKRLASQSLSLSVGFNGDVSTLDTAAFMRSEPSARLDGIHSSPSLSEFNSPMNHAQTPGCSYNDWQPWTVCSKSCGGGMKSRTRTGNTANCEQYSADADCNTHDCAVDCKWKDWGVWSSCSVSCGSAGVVTRVRVEDLRENGGKRCTGSGIEAQPCPSSLACGPVPITGPNEPGLNMRATGVHGIITMVTSNVATLVDDKGAVPPLIHALTDLATVPDTDVKVGLKKAGANLELWFTVAIASSSAVADSKQTAGAILDRLKAKSTTEVAKAIQSRLQQHGLSCVVSVASMKLDTSYTLEPVRASPATSTAKPAPPGRPIRSGSQRLPEEPTPAPTPPSGGQQSARSSLVTAALLLLAMLMSVTE